MLDLADSDADVDPIEDDSPPPNMSSSHRHRDAQRVYEAAPTGGHSSPDPLTLEGKPPFNLTSRPQSGQFPAFENRNTSKYEALSMHGKVQSGVEQFGGGVGGKTKVVAKMQGVRSWLLSACARDELTDDLLFSRSVPQLPSRPRKGDAERTAPATPRTSSIHRPLRRPSRTSPRLPALPTPSPLSSRFRCSST